MIESVCDGGTGTLEFPGQASGVVTTTHSESIEWGPTRKFVGRGGNVVGTYFTQPFTITYVVATG